MDLTIASIKPKVFTITQSKNMPVFSHTHIVRGIHSLGLAHNECFRKASFGLIVFTGDDMVIDEAVWQYVAQVKPGSFAMLDEGDFGITGVFAIHYRDFWRVGGFDESLRYGSVDRDFYCRAVLAGLKFIPIPLTLVKHIKHKRRSATIYKAFKVLRDAAVFVGRYFTRFPKEILVHDFADRVRRLQFRHVLLELLFFYRYVVFGWIETANAILECDQP